MIIQKNIIDGGRHVVEACGKASTVQQLSTIEIYIQHRERYQNNQNIYYHKLRT